MKRITGWAAGFGGLFLCAACATDLATPFQRTSGHFSFTAAETGTDYQFISNHETYGVEWLADEEGTSGWGYEGSVRVGSASGGGSDRIRDPDRRGHALDVHVQRDSDFRDISFGVRQTYRPDSSLRPYFGVGGTFQRVRNVNHYEPLEPGLQVPAKLRLVDHIQGNGPALYAHTGLQWSFLHDRLGRDTEFVLALDVRGMIGDEYDTLELGISLGFGK